MSDQNGSKLPQATKAYNKIRDGERKEWTNKLQAFLNEVEDAGFKVVPVTILIPGRAPHSHLEVQ